MCQHDELSTSETGGMRRLTDSLGGSWPAHATRTHILLYCIIVFRQRRSLIRLGQNRTGIRTLGKEKYSQERTCAARLEFWLRRRVSLLAIDLGKKIDCGDDFGSVSSGRRRKVRGGGFG